MTQGGPDLAERDQVVLSVLPDSGEQRTIRTWTRYSLNHHFLSPTAGWDFELGGKTIDRALLDMLHPGVKVRMAVNGHPQCTGRIDSIEVHADRSSGTVLRIHGRDMLAQALDGNADPQHRFTRDMTLQTILEGIFVQQFGFAEVVGDSGASKNVITGQTRGLRRSPKRQRPIRSIQMHQTQPYAHEGGYAFAERLALRHGYHLWCTADGTGVVVDAPNEDGEPIYTLRRKTDAAAALHNNIVSGSVTLSMQSQPTHIVCDGFGGGAEFGHSRLRCFILNPVFQAQNSVVVDSYPDAVPVETDFIIISPPPLLLPHPRIVYLHDEESRTIEQLQNFARRQLALHMSRSLVARYEVAGHTQGGIPWSVDTMVNVQDDIAGLHEPMYILSRTFTKDRHGGTRTHLELIRAGSLAL